MKQGASLSNFFKPTNIENSHGAQGVQQRSWRYGTLCFSVLLQLISQYFAGIFCKNRNLFWLAHIMH